MNPQGITNSNVPTVQETGEILSISLQISPRTSSSIKIEAPNDKQSIINDLSEFFGHVIQPTTHVQSVAPTNTLQESTIKQEEYPKTLQDTFQTNSSREETEISDAISNGDSTRWNSNDDQVLLQIVNNAPKGFNWDAIQHVHFPGRTPRSLVGRYQALRRKKAFTYVNGIVKVSKMYLKRNKIVIDEAVEAQVSDFIKRPSTPWTKADNAKFLTLIKDKEPKTINWDEISKEFVNRPQYNLQCKFRQMKKYHFFEVVNGLCEITKPKRRNQLRAEDKKKQGKNQKKKDDREEVEAVSSSESEEDEMEEDMSFELKTYDTKTRRKSHPIQPDTIQEEEDEEEEEEFVAIIVQDDKRNRVVWNQSDVSLFKEVYYGLGTPDVPNFKDFCDVLPEKSINDFQNLYKLLMDRGQLKNE